jgi:hypothetical protein
MEWFFRTLLNVALIWGIIYFVDWVNNGDFQKTVVTLFALVMIDLLDIRNKIGN